LLFSSVRRFAGNARELGSRAPGRSADVPAVRLGHASRGRLAPGVEEQKLRFRSFSVRRLAGNARELGSRAPGRSADVPTVRLGHASRGRLASGRLHV